MFSVFEKIKFVLTTKILKDYGNTRNSPKRKYSRPVRILLTTAKSIVFVLILLTAIAILISQFMPPTISVIDSSNDKVIEAMDNPYMIKGTVISGSENQLAINETNVELVGSDFTHIVELSEGDNRFIFEASNKRGVTKEIYVIHYVDGNERSTNE